MAYLIGLALGDGNLSNPNGRAVRLRISCDPKYPKLVKAVALAMQSAFPLNKVGIFRQKTCIEVGVYSNKLTSALGWHWQKGPKDKQDVGIPNWIVRNKNYGRACLRGLFQTDGSIYVDRGYQMVNFTNVCAELIKDTLLTIEKLGYKPNLQRFRKENGKTKYTIRITREARRFIEEIGLWKD